ncbi:MAG: hypothetical protein ABIO36_06695 [Pyrinomonadaceae bacterium]
MKCRFLFLVFIICGAVIPVAAQVKTVTNADLAKYKQERIKGENDLRENYAKLGFASPEELERMGEQSRIETAELSAKLRSERLERERIETQRLANEQFANEYYHETTETQTNYDNGVSFFSLYNRRYRPQQRTNRFQQPGYFAGGQFWPTRLRTPHASPVWIRPRH